MSRLAKSIIGFFILFWSAIVDLLLAAWAMSGKLYPIVTLLIGVWLGYQYSPWFTMAWLKLNRKLDEWANV